MGKTPLSEWLRMHDHLKVKVLVNYLEYWLPRGMTAGQMLEFFGYDDVHEPYYAFVNLLLGAHESGSGLDVKQEDGTWKRYTASQMQQNVFPSELIPGPGASLCFQRNYVHVHKDEVAVEQAGQEFAIVIRKVTRQEKKQE